eukprot:PhF_6_TR3402/c0_g1_i4/m.4895
MPKPKNLPHFVGAYDNSVINQALLAWAQCVNDGNGLPSPLYTLVGNFLLLNDSQLSFALDMHSTVPLARSPNFIQIPQNMAYCDGTPGWAEYEVYVPCSGMYTISSCMMAYDPRPLQLMIDDNESSVVTIASHVSGSWDHQTLSHFTEKCIVPLRTSPQRQDKIKLKVSTSGFYPHMWSILFHVTTREAFPVIQCTALGEHNMINEAFTVNIPVSSTYTLKLKMAASVRCPFVLMSTISSGYGTDEWVRVGDGMVGGWTTGGKRSCGDPVWIEEPSWRAQLRAGTYTMKLVPQYEVLPAGAVVTVAGVEFSEWVPTIPVPITPPADLLLDSVYVRMDQTIAHSPNFSLSPFMCHANGTGGWATYRVYFRQTAGYQFSIEMTAADPRPVDMFLDGVFCCTTCPWVTGTWSECGIVRHKNTSSAHPSLHIVEGHHEIRFATDGFFPHVRALVFDTVDSEDRERKRNLTAPPPARSAGSGSRSSAHKYDNNKNDGKW